VPTGPLGRALRTALALALLAGAGCGESKTATCPGEPIGSFQLEGTLSSAECGVPSAPNPFFASMLPPKLPPVRMTISSTGAQVAACTNLRYGAIYHGARDGDRVTVQTATEGAVLAGCAATCSATATYAIDGVVRFGPGGVEGFGRVDADHPATYTERFEAPGSDCRPCTLPCTAVYEITGAP
jgi:hypothetical protein